MKNGSAFRLVAALAIAGVISCSSSQPAGPPAADVPAGAVEVTAFTNVDVIPMTGETILRGQTVIVADDHIAAVGETGRSGIPPGATIVDARGKTLIPGLVDMHIHLPPDAGEPGGAARRVLAMMVANGVTTARSLAGHPAQLELRKRIREGEIIGPTLYLAAPALHQKSAPTAEAARDAVAAAKAAGFDLIKSHAIEDPAVWLAVQNAARDAGLPVSGHVTNAVGLERALAEKQQIEHLDGFVHALLPEGSPAASAPWGQIPPAPVLADVDRARLPEVARRVGASGAWNTPTLALFERIADVTTPVEVLRGRPEMAYVTPAALDQWGAQRAQLVQSGYLDGVSGPFVSLRRDIVKALHAAGAPLLAGSDTPQAFLLTGFALHDELEALVRAGLSPHAALAAATVNPVRYFRSLPKQGSATGVRAEFGTIEPGARADLVLLDRNPLENIGATRAIRGVMLGGKWLDREALDRLLETARPAPPAATAAAPGTIFLVRHGETDGVGSDPELSAAGRARAERLAGLLGSETVTRILTTDRRRTRQTAEPLAKRLGIEPEIYQPGDLAGLAAALRSRGGTLLVVGHSNTTPQVVKLLGGDDGSPIGDAEYDRLYRVALPSGSTTLQRY